MCIHKILQYGGISKLVSNDNNLSKIYNQVYEELKTRSDYVLKSERGRLYSIISEILEESNPGSRQEITNIICNEVKIKNTNVLDDDFKVVRELLSEVFTERQFTSKIFPQQVKNLANQVIVGLNQHLNTNEEDSMKWLVVAACMLVGVYPCLQYLKRHLKGLKKDKVTSGQANLQRPPLEKQPARPIPAGLCLVVPASEIRSIQVGSSIDGGRLAELINSASYFLCKLKTEAEKLEVGLDLTDDPIPVDSPKEVYARITIPDGKAMIISKTRYEIKENIKDDGQYKVESLNCLKNLSGLGSFTRI